MLKGWGWILIITIIFVCLFDVSRVFSFPVCYRHPTPSGFVIKRDGQLLRGLWFIAIDWLWLWKKGTNVFLTYSRSLSLSPTTYTHTHTQITPSEKKTEERNVHTFPVSVILPSSSSLFLFKFRLKLSLMLYKPSLHSSYYTYSRRFRSFSLTHHFVFSRLRFAFPFDRPSQYDLSKSWSVYILVVLFNAIQTRPP